MPALNIGFSDDARAVGETDLPATNEVLFANTFTGEQDSARLPSFAE
ncbi:hypothetical protein ABIA65_000784 [Mycolicibacterium sp. 624]